MKYLLLLLIVLSVIGCDGLTSISVYTHDIGEFELLRDASIVVGSGDYQAGIKMLASGVFSSITSGGLLINGLASFDITENGEHWLIISTGGMSSGDIGSIQTTVIEDNYYLEEGPIYTTFTLNIEVE